ncbi:cytochrome P450 4V2 [Trichonephila inaurata madagascariensis]|uniref:Cytochrome P450 4V2 n=1 Tax=Trichonephila inaurata madagascariensis TaxID=2747483 RepID=A0A8X6X1W8_9ARAC|nr:cytochrome P450 4V2 [Trichonephila inaurata madagascariensis]
MLHALMGTGLVTSPVEIWKPRRKLLTPCFHSAVLREYLKVFNECSQDLVKHLQQETKKDFTHIDPPLALTTMDIIYKTMIDTTVGALENDRSQLINIMKSLADMSMSRHLKFWEWSDFIHNLTTGRKIKRQLKLIEDLIESIIQEKKKQYLSGNKDNVKGKRKAFMDLLLELHFENQELSEKDILDEVNTFIAALFGIRVHRETTCSEYAKKTCCTVRQCGQRNTIYKAEYHIM